MWKAEQIVDLVKDEKESTEILKIARQKICSLQKCKQIKSSR